MIPKLTFSNIAKFFAFAALSLPTQSLFAVEADANEEAVTWYQVEVLLFKNNKDYKQDKNNISLSIPSPEEQYILVKGDPMVSNQLKRLPNNSLILNKSFKAMSRSNDFEVLEFAGWKQALIKDKTGIPLTIKTGEQFGERYELEGQLTFRKNRYLHVKADLYLANYIEGTSTNLQEWLLEDQLKAGSFSSTTQINPPPTKQSNVIMVQEEAREAFYTEESTTSYVASNIAHMSESRRMRSGEIHFLDHPKFGVLVTIEPTDPPFVYTKQSEVSNKTGINEN